MKILEIVKRRGKQFNIRLLFAKPIFIFKAVLKYSTSYFRNSQFRGVSFATSYQCNFKCVHCYARKFTKTEEPALTLYEKVAVLDEARQLGGMAIDFVGGEIGISPDFEKILDIYGPWNTYVSLASNGYEMSRERVRELKRAGVDKISVSIDNGTALEHDAFRRKQGSFDRCFQALENIRAEGLTPVIITTVCRQDTKKPDFWKLVDYAVDNKISLVFTAAIPFGEWEGRTDLLCDEEDLATMLDLHAKHPFITRDIYENVGRYGCPASKQILYISEFGDVMPCAFTHISFGNVKRESLSDIRKRMLQVEVLAEYHQTCLASEDRQFIDAMLRASSGRTEYPLQHTDLFPNLVESGAFARKSVAKRTWNCPLCGANAPDYLASGREHEFTDTTSDLFCLVKCSVCDFIYLDPRPDDSELGAIYPANYYCHKSSFERSSNDTSLLLRIKKKLNEKLGYAREIRALLESLPHMPEGEIKVLDIGCGNGEALDLFARYSPVPIKTIGLDFNKNALEIIAAKGHGAIEGKIEEVELPDASFDIIYSNNVIEHIVDPLGMLVKVRKALKPNGLFVCLTPNYDSLCANLFGRSGHWGGYHFPRHLTFFTAKTMRTGARLAGLEVHSATYKPIPIFWIWTGHSLLARKFGKPELADKLFPLREASKSFAWTFLLKTFFTIIEKLGGLIGQKPSILQVVLKRGHGCG